MSEDGITQYGFRWGPMIVERLAHVEGRGYSLRVATDHAVTVLHVTEKGRKITPYPQRILPGDEG